MSAHFSVPLYWGVSWSDIDEYVDENTNVLLADCHTSTTVHSSFSDTVDPNDPRYHTGLINLT